MGVWKKNCSKKYAEYGRGKIYSIQSSMLLVSLCGSMEASALYCLAGGGRAGGLEQLRAVI